MDGFATPSPKRKRLGGGVANPERNSVRVRPILKQTDKYTKLKN